jgi:hypothetical protein
VFPLKKDLPPCGETLASTKSARAEIDCAAPMGRGATATLERLAASLGRLGAMVPRFEDALDIPKGGVLLALPALLVCGLLRHAGQYFQLPPGVLRARDDLSALGLPGARTPQIDRGPARRGNGASSWGLTAFRRCGRSAPSSSTWPSKGRPSSGALHSARSGWRRRQRRPPCYTSMATSGSTTDLRPVYPSTTWRASSCVYGPPPTTGSTRWTVNPSSSSTRRSIRGCCRSWRTTSFHASNTTCPTNSVRRNWPAIRYSIASRSSSIAKAIARPSSPG